MSRQHLGSQGHRLCLWLYRSATSSRGVIAGVKWGALAGVICLVILGGMLLNAHPLAVRVESAGAAVAAVFCGGIFVVGVFAFAGALIGRLIDLWRGRPND